MSQSTLLKFLKTSRGFVIQWVKSLEGAYDKIRCRN